MSQPNEYGNNSENEELMRDRDLGKEKGIAKVRGVNGSRHVKKCGNSWSRVGNQS